MRYASFGKRLWAYLIDSVIIGLIAGVPGGCLGALAGTLLSSADEELFVLLIVGIVLIAVAFSLVATVLYYGMMWSRTGQTLGKKWLGIKVVTADGYPPSFWRAVGRAFLGYGISGMILDIGFLWMLWDDYRQCLHDKLFSTYVVEV